MKQYNKSIKGKLFGYFQQVLRIKQSTNGWWRCNCYWCGGNYTMGINLEKGNVHCFKCEEQKPPLELLMDMQHFEQISDAYKFLSIQQEYEAYEKYSRQKPREYKQVELPKGFKLLNMGENAIGKAARHYIKKRGFNADKLSSMGVGYCDEGEYFGYIVFPYYCKGQLVYYQGRLFMGVGTKMKNPADEEFGVGKSQVIWNQDALFVYRKAYIVESITNALTLGSRGTGINGKAISLQQLSTYLHSPCEEYVIALDPDAWDNAIDLGLKLCNHKRVRIIKLPDDKDVNDIGKKDTIKLVKESHVMRYMDLYKLKLDAQRPINTHYGRGPYQNPGRT